MQFFMGIVQWPWWGYVVYTLLMTHITIASVTIYLHRYSAHRALEFVPIIIGPYHFDIVSHFFRLWLWLTTGMRTREWTAVHRKHHACVEIEGDPHSPHVFGIWRVLFEGTELYKKGAANAETLETFGAGTPDDWIERNVYTPLNLLGIGIMLAINVLLFGPIGITIWAVQMLWIPLFAAGVINGVTHYWGYRNFDTQDESRNLIPWGIIIGGEELHNNHHAYPTSARLSKKWWEFDIGWLYIQILVACYLVRVKRYV